MFADNIKKLARENSNFRHVLFTGTNSQIVVMSIPIGGDIGQEVHPITDQILMFVEGVGEAILNDETKNVGADDIVFVPAGTMHNFKNTGSTDLKLITIYAPPEHPDGTIHKTKEDAEKDER